LRGTGQRVNTRGDAGARPPAQPRKLRYGAPTVPGDGFEVGKLGKLGKHFRDWDEHILQVNDQLLGPARCVPPGTLRDSLGGDSSAVSGSRTGRASFGRPVGFAASRPSLSLLACGQERPLVAPTPLICEPRSRMPRSLRPECLSLRLASSEIVEGQGRSPCGCQGLKAVSAALRPCGDTHDPGRFFLGQFG
jgi:hypothetical protein